MSDFYADPVQKKQMSHFAASLPLGPIEGKQRRKLAELPFDERKRQVAERIFRDMKGDIHHLTPQQFEKMVWTQLYQLELVNMEQPGAAPPH
uniref:hypothetical protein n=1 Tax=Escherichia coli TaxID=562 RepID=UPI004041D35B